MRSLPAEILTAKPLLYNHRAFPLTVNETPTPWKVKLLNLNELFRTWTRKCAHKHVKKQQNTLVAVTVPLLLAELLQGLSLDICGHLVSVLWLVFKLNYLRSHLWLKLYFLGGDIYLIQCTTKQAKSKPLTHECNFDALHWHCVWFTSMYVVFWQYPLWTVTNTLKAADNTAPSWLKKGQHYL